MISVVLHFVGVDVDNIEREAFELRNLYVGGECRHHQSHLVALAYQEVLLNGIESIAHSGRSTLGGKQVVDALVVGRSAHGQAQIVLHDQLCGAQDAVGRGILVADHGLSEFMRQCVGVVVVFIDKVVEGLSEQFRSGAVFVVGKERAETCAAVLHLRDAGYADRVICHATALL